MDETRIDIVAIRKAYRLTQQGLADKLGVNLSTVWRWENGQEPKGPVKALLARMRDEAPLPAQEPAPTNSNASTGRAA